ncbi:MAG: class I SAM-dependent methyltransferase [Terriglobales bacterium]
MPSDSSRQLSSALRTWWRDHARAQGSLVAASLLVRELFEFLRDSTPERRRSRYGDMDYDWEQHVNTTAGAVNWRTRLLGVFHSPYQPTEPALFREMMAALPIDFREFTFIDIGSGKGRALLMAAEYPFRRIIGVELISELHRSAEENIAVWRAQSPAPQMAAIDALCMDAREFVFPETPLVIYLFNPLPEAGLRQTVLNLEESWKRTPRAVWIVYHNPLLENVLTESEIFAKERGELGYSVFKTKYELLINRG